MSFYILVFWSASSYRLMLQCQEGQVWRYCWKHLCGRASKRVLKPKLLSWVCWGPETHGGLVLGNLLLRVCTFSARGIQAGGAPWGNSLDLPWNSIQTNVSIEGFQWSVTLLEKLSLLRGLLTKLVTWSLFMSRAVWIDLSISSGRERARLEQGTVAQRKTCPWCVAEAFSGLSWVLCVPPQLPPVAAWSDPLFTMSKRRVFLEAVVSPGHRGDPHCTVTQVGPTVQGPVPEETSFFRALVVAAGRRKYFSEILLDQWGIKSTFGLLFLISVSVKGSGTLLKSGSGYKVWLLRYSWMIQ